jgi:hypothetical protein
LITSISATIKETITTSWSDYAKATGSVIDTFGAAWGIGNIADVVGVVECPTSASWINDTTIGYGVQGSP